VVHIKQINYLKDNSKVTLLAVANKSIRGVRNMSSSFGWTY